jgi:hypothetical protein
MILFKIETEFKPLKENPSRNALSTAYKRYEMECAGETVEHHFRKTMTPDEYYSSFKNVIGTSHRISGYSYWKLVPFLKWGREELFNVDTFDNSGGSTETLYKGLYKLVISLKGVSVGVFGNMEILAHSCQDDVR